MLVAMLVFTLAMIGVGLVNSFWLTVPLFLVAMIAVGVIGPVRQAYIHHLIPSAQRATVISFDSMIANTGGIFSQTALGQVSRQAGIAQAYVLGGAAMLFTLPLLFMLRRLGGPADLIEGEAGHKGGCAGQGLPDSAQVDSRPNIPLPVAESGD
jgi:MFS family permease